MHFEEKEDNIKISDIVPDIHLCIETHASKSNLLAKMCQILVVWFGRSILDTFFGNILGLGAYFSKPFFALRP